MAKRRRFTPQFKAEVVIEALHNINWNSTYLICFEYLIQKGRYKHCEILPMSNRNT